uniref:5-formyltetrahydrofolate cyclo-ligase n=1 Tax=Timema genevievae TaxID=629358 RepID=A0A7R9PN87_TIMGE|nr:unnamed protein product [Timema genevievae]
MFLHLWDVGVGNQIGGKCFSIPRQDSNPDLYIAILSLYATDSTHMDMLRVNTLQELESLPLTKWNIRQPLISDERENALNTGNRNLPASDSLAQNLYRVPPCWRPPGNVLLGLARQSNLLSGWACGLDLIVVPGLAFSRQGARLGRGKGYYDTYLTKCRQLQNTPPVTVGLAFKQQVLDNIPTQEFDVKMDHVLFVE